MNPINYLKERIDALVKAFLPDETELIIEDECKGCENKHDEGEVKQCENQKQ